MFVITIDSLKYRLFFLALFLWHGARDWESQIQVQLIVRKMPSHWAPSEIEPKVPCGTVRESNLGPLCAIPTTLTTQPLRLTKVWPLYYSKYSEKVSFLPINLSLSFSLLTRSLGSIQMNSSLKVNDNVYEIIYLMRWQQKHDIDIASGQSQLLKVDKSTLLFM